MFSKQGQGKHKQMFVVNKKEPLRQIQRNRSHYKENIVLKNLGSLPDSLGSTPPTEPLAMKTFTNYEFICPASTLT